MTAPIRVLLCDDHTILREGIAALLATAPDMQIVGQAGDGVEAIELAVRLRPQVVVTDIAMPRLNGIEVVRRLGQQLPDTRVLVLTMHTEEEYVLHLIRAGAAGYLLKDSAGTELLSAVRAIAQGRGYFGTHAARVMAQQVQQPQARLDDPYRDLTDREREVFHLVIEGLTTKDVARRLDIAVKTAENHRTRAMEKLGVKNVAELIRYAVRHRLMD